MNRNLAVALAAFIAMTVTVSGARADSIPWGYAAGNAEIFNNNNGSKTSAIQFAGASGVATGNSGIIIYNMTTMSTASEASPDNFFNVPFDVSFNLTDVLATGSSSGSAKSTDLVHFSGLFSASNVTTQSLFPGAAPWTSPPTAELVLGADDVGWRTYSVMLTSFTSPGQPGGSPGSIQAVVTIRSNDEGPGGGEDPPPPSATPEPATLVLASLMALPLAVWARKRRQQKDA
jgi:hypothetical protein